MSDVEPSFPWATTEVYPTRYAALGDPGTWYLFRPVEGEFRHCREDAPRRPVENLGVWPDHGGEVAVFVHPDGGYVEIRGQRAEFLVDVTFENSGRTARGGDLRTAMVEAERLLAALRANGQSDRDS